MVCKVISLQVHMGRGEWISYDIYVLSMNGVTYKSRRTFLRNLCVGVFGYDLLSRSTISGHGSNRNGKVNKPVEMLDSNKVLAIKGKNDYCHKKHYFLKQMLKYLQLNTMK